MGMQMDRHFHGGFQAAHQLIGVERGQQTGHVLDAERVGAEIFELLGQIDKAVDAVNRADGIADRRFHMFAAGFYFTDRPFDVPHIVQRIEDAEDVDAICGGPFDEPFEDIVGIMAIAHEVLPAEQHLQLGMRHGGAQRAQPFPGIFFEKTQTGVEGRAAPDFQRPIADGVELLGDRQHVLRSHARGQEGLMPVAQRDVGDQDRLARGRLNGRGRADGSDGFVTADLKGASLPRAA